MHGVGRSALLMRQDLAVDPERRRNVGVPEHLACGQRLTPQDSSETTRRLLAAQDDGSCRLSAARRH